MAAPVFRWRRWLTIGHVWKRVREECELAGRSTEGSARAFAVSQRGSGAAACRRRAKGVGPAIAHDEVVCGAPPNSALKLTGFQPERSCLAALLASPKAAVVPSIHVEPRLVGPQLNARRSADAGGFESC